MHTNACLKSVVDKDGVRDFSERVATIGTLNTTLVRRRASYLFVPESRLLTCLACYCAIIGRCIGLLLLFLKSKL